VIQPQVSIGVSNFGIWHEAIYQLALDFSTLFDLHNRLDPASLRVSEIDQGLKDVTLFLDLELPLLEILKNIPSARELLRPLLDCINGTTVPIFYAFGHAHLDLAWLWPLAETKRKIARTIINQLALIDEYPDFRFLQSQPFLYKLLKDHYPELYDRFVIAIASGSIIADGAMWIEADTNLSGGESLIRQIIYAKQFFKDEFSIDSQVLWLPDVFGYSGALPQILRGCDCIGFATQKITWLYNGGDPFPYNTFLWEGIDGTTIPAHIFTDYNSDTHPGNLLDRWETRLQSDGVRSMIFAFGWGDGGGGPTRDQLEFIRREANLEGLPRVFFSTPKQFFMDLEQQGALKERYVGELYFQAHRGTYTSQAKIKQNNRRGEFSLREAEFWITIAHMMNDFEYDPHVVKSNWLKLLLNQFHDILPGSSIHRVYEEAAESYTDIISSSNDIARLAASSFTREGDSVTIFNSLSWERTVLVDLPHKSELVKIPACGWTTLENKNSQNQAEKNSVNVIATVSSLENDILIATLNSNGELISLVDKGTGFEMLAGAGNRFCLFNDVPSNFDAWDIDSMTETQLLQTEEPVELEVVQSDPNIAIIQLSRKINHSSINQQISLQKDSRRIDFKTTIDWQESHKLLKVAFPVNLHANEAIHEIQFGYIKRPNHRSRPFDTDRFEVCNHKWTALAEENRGVAILNNCKYGINVLGNNINLTLLKSSLAPDPGADKGLQTFTYSIYYWTGSFYESNVVHEAYELNSPVLILPGSGGENSIFTIDAPNIILETIKPAESGNKGIVLRMYESKHAATRCTLTTNLPVFEVSQTDMLESYQNKLSINNGKIALEFHPFEIKTILLSFNPSG
jgi:alpha-mannosidase